MLLYPTAAENFRNENEVASETEVISLFEQLRACLEP